MSSHERLNGFTAAATVLKWLRAWYTDNMPEAIDLDVVRQMLPSTPYGKGVIEIKPPLPLSIDSCEGMLVRNPENPAEWGIFYNANARFERVRFTITHELGHFILHRHRQIVFNCDKISIHTGHDTLRVIEREADDFASNLLMPGDSIRAAISRQKIDLHLLSELATRFQVSFEALCIRFIKYTERRAILVRWDNGFLDYQWRSRKAVLTRAKVRCVSSPQERLHGTLAADDSVIQAWDGIEMPASLWCEGDTSCLNLREFKHSYSARDRVLTLLLLD